MRRLMLLVVALAFASMVEAQVRPSGGGGGAAGTVTGASVLTATGCTSANQIPYTTNGSTFSCLALGDGVLPNCAAGQIPYTADGSAYTCITYSATAARAFSAGNFTASSGNWTVEEADWQGATTFRVGNYACIALDVIATTVSATPNYLRYNTGVAPLANGQDVIYVSDAGTTSMGIVSWGAGDATVYFWKLTGNWTASTDTTQVRGSWCYGT